MFYFMYSYSLQSCHTEVVSGLEERVVMLIFEGWSAKKNSLYHRMQWQGPEVESALEDDFGLFKDGSAGEAIANCKYISAFSLN